MFSFLWRKVREKQGVAARGKAVAFQDFRRQRVGNISFEIFKNCVDDSPQHPRADAADGFVNRHDAADFGGVGGSAFGGANQLDLRIDHLQPARAIEIAVNFSVQHEFLAVLQPSFEIAAMKKTNVYFARSVAHGHVKNRAAAAREANRGASSAGDFGENRVDLPGNDFGNGREAKAVFVAEGKIAEQIGDGENAALFERGGALRTDSAQIFDRIGKSDGHSSETRERRPITSLLYHLFARRKCVCVLFGGGLKSICSNFNGNAARCVPKGGTQRPLHKPISTSRSSARSLEEPLPAAFRAKCRTPRPLQNPTATGNRLGSHGSQLSWHSTSALDRIPRRDPSRKCDLLFFSLTTPAAGAAAPRISPGLGQPG